MDNNTIKKNAAYVYFLLKSNNNSNYPKHLPVDRLEINSRKKNIFTYFIYLP